MPALEFLDAVLSARMPQPQEDAAYAPEPSSSAVDPPADGCGHLSKGQISAASIVGAIVGIALISIAIYFSVGRPLIARFCGRRNTTDKDNNDGDYAYHRAHSGTRRGDGGDDYRRADRAKSRGEEEKEIEGWVPRDDPGTESKFRFPTEATATAGPSRGDFETAQVRGVGGNGMERVHSSDFPVTRLAPAPQRRKPIPTPAAYEQPSSSSRPEASSPSSPYDQDWPLGPSTESALAQAGRGRSRAATFSDGSQAPALPALRRADSDSEAKPRNSFQEISLH